MVAMPSSPEGAVVLTTFVFGLQAEDTLRKSFEQQLCDAIAVIKGMYMVGGECCQGQGQLWVLCVQEVKPALSFHSLLRVLRICFLKFQVISEKPGLDYGRIH